LIFPCGFSLTDHKLEARVGRLLEATSPLYPNISQYPNIFTASEVANQNFDFMFNPKAGIQTTSMAEHVV